MLDKSDRLVKLVEAIGEDWNFTDTEKADVRRAAYLSKSDLATGMVTEFTELQGEMGKEYALLDGEEPKVAAAILNSTCPVLLAMFFRNLLSEGRCLFQISWTIWRRRFFAD